MANEPKKTIKFSYFDTEFSINEKRLNGLPPQGHFNIFDLLPKEYKNNMYYITVYLDERELKLCYLINTYFDTDYVHDLNPSGIFDVTEEGDIVYTGSDIEEAGYYAEENLYYVCLKQV